MSEYHSNNKDVKVNAAPLFASSWLALFSVLRENYNESRAVPELDESLILLKGESVEQPVSDGVD